MQDGDSGRQSYYFIRTTMLYFREISQTRRKTFEVNCAGLLPAKWYLFREEVLANDVQKLNLGKTPKITERRGEHRTVKEVADILSLVTFVDAKKAITGLQRYATIQIEYQLPDLSRVPFFYYCQTW